MIDFDMDSPTVLAIGASLATVINAVATVITAWRRAERQLATADAQAALVPPA